MLLLVCKCLNILDIKFSITVCALCRFQTLVVDFIFLAFLPFTLSKSTYPPMMFTLCFFFSWRLALYFLSNFMSQYWQETSISYRLVFHLMFAWNWFFMVPQYCTLWAHCFFVMSSVIFSHMFVLLHLFTERFWTQCTVFSPRVNIRGGRRHTISNFPIFSNWKLILYVIVGKPILRRP